MWIVLELSNLDIHGTNFKFYVKPSLKLTKGENYDNFKVNSKIPGFWLVIMTFGDLQNDYKVRLFILWLFKTFRVIISL